MAAPGRAPQGDGVPVTPTSEDAKRRAPVAVWPATHLPFAAVLLCVRGNRARVVKDTGAHVTVPLADVELVP